MKEESGASIAMWAVQTFGDNQSTLALVRRSIDELLEAAEHCVVKNEQTRVMFAAMRMGLQHLDKYERQYPDHVEVMKEVADSMVVNYHLAGARQFSMQYFINEKMAINRARKWKKNSDGTGQHIKET